ncbi:Nn.00g084730.m01.CDS01 [Neocucurbitaria sp. VM-36]
MPSENTHADLKQESSVARSDLRDDVNLATPQDPTAPPEPQTTQESQAAKESYDAYIKNLPPPFWETKIPQTKAANDEAIASRINAVCAPVTAEQREEDERLKTMSWRERWRDRKARREAKEKNKDPDLRPVERGSRAQLNVFSSNIKEKQGKR